MKSFTKWQAEINEDIGTTPHQQCPHCGQPIQVIDKSTGSSQNSSNLELRKPFQIAAHHKNGVINPVTAGQGFSNQTN